MTEKSDVKQDLEKDTKNVDPKVRVEVIEDLDVPGEDADALRGASGHIICANQIQR